MYNICTYYVIRTVLFLYRHKRLRPHLVQVIRKRKMDLCKQEVKLCERYDTLLSEWEKKVEKVEGNAKRK